MKKALTNTLIYYVLVAALYFIAVVFPDPIAYYAAIIFFMTHFLGVMIVNLFYISNPSEYPHSKYIVICVLITVNAAVVFLVSWFRKRSQDFYKQQIINSGSQKRISPNLRRR